MEAAETDTQNEKDHIGKLPGDDGWFRLAVHPSILPWTICFALLVLFLIPAGIALFTVEAPTTPLLGLGAMYVVALLGSAAGCDRAVQLERIRRRQN